jgi:hypothetical protein
VRDRSGRQPTRRCDAAAERGNDRQEALRSRTDASAW